MVSVDHIRATSAGVSDELELLEADYRRAGMPERANRIAVARAIVAKECAEAMAQQGWRDEATQTMEGGR